MRKRASSRHWRASLGPARAARTVLGGLIALGVAHAATLTTSSAQTSQPAPRTLCVSCSGPNATYRCLIAKAKPGAPQQLSCMTALADHGRHDSCAIRRGQGARCAGPAMTLGYGADGTPQIVARLEGEPRDRRAGPDGSVPPSALAAPVAILPRRLKARPDDARPLRPRPAPSTAQPPSTVSPPPGPRPATAARDLRRPPPAAPANEPASAPKPAPATTAARPKPPTRTRRPKREPETVEALAKQVTRATNRQLKKTSRDINNAAKKTWRCVASLFQKC